MGRLIFSGMNYYPPGGFMSFLQSGQPFIPHVSATWPPMGKESQLAPSKNDSGNQNAKKRLKDKTIINLDDGNDGRTAKRLVFEPEEDVRLVSKIVSLTSFLYHHKYMNLQLIMYAKFRLVHC